MSWFLDLVTELTGDSASKAAEAGHDARTDMGARENEDDWSSAPEWAKGQGTESGIPFFPEGKG